jgi:hypothetical protein
MKRGEKMSEEQKRKISESEKGKFVSAVTRRKISENQAGRKLPDWLKLKISLAHKRRVISERQMAQVKLLGLAGRGRVVSESTRRKLSEGISRAVLQGKMRRKNKRLHYNGLFMRSSWEVKVAEWLDEHKIAWEYECYRYMCGNGRVYIPDFKLLESCDFLEVKGFVSGDDKYKMSEFVKAGHTLFIVDNTNINNINLEKKWVCEG